MGHRISGHYLNKSPTEHEKERSGRES